jgi:hypothetical protein
MAKFKEMYPEDWDSLVYRYKEHERHTPAGQPHLMREPTQHLSDLPLPFSQIPLKMQGLVYFTYYSVVM